MVPSHVLSVPTFRRCPGGKSQQCGKERHAVAAACSQGKRPGHGHHPTIKEQATWPFVQTRAQVPKGDATVVVVVAMMAADCGAVGLGVCEGGGGGRGGGGFVVVVVVVVIV